MKNLNDLTVVIVTFQTPEKIILDCLRSINKDVKIIHNMFNGDYESLPVSSSSNCW